MRELLQFTAISAKLAFKAMTLPKVGIGGSSEPTSKMIFFALAAWVEMVIGVKTMI